MEKVDEILGNQKFDFVCLVNNASAVEPIKSIEKCPSAEIDSHVRIGMIAPMILTSMFIRKFSDEKIRKKVVFISQGLPLLLRLAIVSTVAPRRESICLLSVLVLNKKIVRVGLK